MLKRGKAMRIPREIKMACLTYLTKRGFKDWKLILLRPINSPFKRNTIHINSVGLRILSNRSDVKASLIYQGL
jgi:hypothetical protein